MKIQCQLCKELVSIGSFRSRRAGIDVTCEACGGTFFVDASSGEAIARPPAEDEPSTEEEEEPASKTRELGEDEMRCPKCRALQVKAESCRSCGLGEEHFADFAKNREEDVPAELEAMWQDCQARWQDDALHESFIERASAAAAFSYAAGCYREVLDDRPDDEIARRHLDRLARMTEAMLLSAAVARKTADEGEQPYKNVIIMLIVLVVLGGVLGIYLLIRNAQEPEPDGIEKPPPTAPMRKR